MSWLSRASWILAHPAALLDEYQLERYETLTRRLESGEPLPYIIGHWEFYGLDFTLSPAVLIPRPETEMLVEHALHWLVEHPARRSILDVGTGSGCIAVSLALNCPDARILASDISLEALLVARQNVLRHGVSDRVQLLQCDLLPPTSLPFDLLCANLPYIPAADIPGSPSQPMNHVWHWMGEKRGCSVSEGSWNALHLPWLQAAAYCWKSKPPRDRWSPD